MQEEQTGRRETEKSEDWQIRQSEGNNAARRLFTASPTIRGACGLPFGMFSKLLLKTGLLKESVKACRQEGREINSRFDMQLRGFSIYQLVFPESPISCGP
jgi:hypothetical protein